MADKDYIETTMESKDVDRIVSARDAVIKSYGNFYKAAAKCEFRSDKPAIEGKYICKLEVFDWATTCQPLSCAMGPLVKDGD